MEKIYYDTYERNEDGDLVVARRHWRYCVQSDRLYQVFRALLPKRKFRVIAGFITKWTLAG